MPLLRREPDIQPENLFSLPSDQFPWCVAHVRSRQEKLLARHLVQHGIPFFLPQCEVRRKREGRTLVSYLPLFTGYVFVRPPAGTRDVIWRSNVAASVIDVADQALLGEELQQIRALQAAGATFKPYRVLAEGDAVRIAEGVFAGYTGRVVREKGRDRLVVSISLLRQSVVVEFGREVLTRIQ